MATVAVEREPSSIGASPIGAGPSVSTSRAGVHRAAGAAASAHAPAGES